MPTMNPQEIVPALRAIAAGNALPADIENALEEEGLIVQDDGPYATLTTQGRALLAHADPEVAWSVIVSAQHGQGVSATIRRAVRGGIDGPHGERNFGRGSTLDDVVAWLNDGEYHLASQWTMIDATNGLWLEARLQVTS